MMMKKKVDAMKNPGLAKLPEKVRNNMGFMKDGGEVTANSISDRDRKFLQEMFSKKDKSKSANSISNRDVEFISKALKKMQEFKPQLLKAQDRQPPLCRVPTMSPLKHLRLQ